MVTITDIEYHLLAEFIESNYGIHLKEAKKTLLMTRLNNVLADMKFKTFTQYYDYITHDKSGKSIITFVDKITTNYTYFMREPDHFYYFKDTVLPEIVPKIKNKDLRVWCAASSTGEEPYTLAMLIDEFFGEEKAFWDTKILATDINSKVLQTAKNGVYRNEALTSLTKMWKLKYFKKNDLETLLIVDKIKNEVIYRKFNLMEREFPFKKKFHVIFCRNVMIYFDTITKDRLVEKFYNCLEDGGYLFIGHSESLNRATTKFNYIKPAVYRK
ncbi:MAG: CheR family methyltransferase [Pleomorphochaeta sp.]